MLTVAVVGFADFIRSLVLGLEMRQMKVVEFVDAVNENKLMTADIIMHKRD